MKHGHPCHILLGHQHTLNAFRHIMGGLKPCLSEQATVETVIKVSGNKRPDPEPLPEETPAPVAASPDADSNTMNSIIHHSWGHLHDRKAIPEVGTKRDLCKKVGGALLLHFQSWLTGTCKMRLREVMKELKELERHSL